MEYTFINADHERLYREAREMLDNEIARQKQEADRLSVEWEHYPEDERKRNQVWLLRHFDECRKPYVKILTDIVALCPTAVTILI